MPATVTAIAAQKGGTGKTALTGSLAPQWAYAGHRTLAMDLDQQANLTYAFAVRPEVLDATIVDVLAPRDPVPITDALMRDVHGVSGLDLVPCDERAEALDIQLRSEAMGVYRLREELEPLLDRYDRVFIDCPPNVGELTMAALLAADEVISPIKLSDTNAVRGLSRLHATVEKLNRRGASVAFKAIVALDYDERELAHQLNLDALRELTKRHGLPLAATRLRKRASWPKAATQDVPLILLAENDLSTRDAQNDVRRLAQELWPAVDFLYPSEITLARRARGDGERLAA
jgi:chromosome partitioning protein